MAAPTPLAVRERVVSAYKRELGSQSELAEVFNLNERTVRHFIQKDRQGDLAPKKGTGRPPSIDDDGLNTLEAMVANEPDKTLSEYCHIFEEVTGIFVSLPVMCRALKKLNLRRNWVSHTGIALNGIHAVQARSRRCDC